MRERKRETDHYKSQLKSVELRRKTPHLVKKGFINKQSQFVSILQLGKFHPLLSSDEKSLLTLTSLFLNLHSSGFWVVNTKFYFLSP